MMVDFPPLHGPIKSTSGLEKISGSVNCVQNLILKIYTGVVRD